jgi:hypothetical protein
LAHRVIRAVLGSGLREYYDPYTGEGMGARAFSWSSLVLELVEPDAAAAGSHVGEKTGDPADPAHVENY